MMTNTIAVISLIIAVFSVIYTVRSNTKTYELTVDYRNDVLRWYSEVVEKTVLLRHIVCVPQFSEAKKLETLASLSALIEIGRFFYPNVDIGDSYGKHKPVAFQGYRNIVIEFLVYFYRIAQRNDADQYIDHLYFLERHFTSSIFRDLNPVEHNKNMCKVTKMKIDTNKTLEDFLNQQPLMENIFVLTTMDDTPKW